MTTKGYETRDLSSRESKYQLLTTYNREVAKMYIKDLESKNKSRANAYEGSILKFLKFIQVDLTRLVKDDIDKFVMDERDVKGTSISQINYDLGRVRDLLKFCIENGKISDTPLKNYTNLKDNLKEKAPTSGKSLTNTQLAKIEEILENPESITTMQGAIVWYLVYKKNIKNKLLVECCSERYEVTERRFHTSHGIVELDERHGNMMSELISRLGKDFGFTQHISDRVMQELGKMVGVSNLKYRDIEKTRSQFSFVCPECEEVYENKAGKWVLVYQRIVCNECGEELKKKFNIELNFLPSYEFEPEKVVHPLMHDNFDSARKKMSFTIDDFNKLQEFQKKVGSLGERYVLDHEIEKLSETGLLPIFIGEVDLSVGYDILSYDENGEEIYIEVKSTVNKNSPFFLSDKEYQIAKEKGDRYFIYRVENVLARNLTEVLLTKYRNPVNNAKFHFEPHDWKITILE